METAATGSRTMRVRLEITPYEELSCPITDSDGPVEEVRINAINGTCNADLVVGEDHHVQRTTDSVDEDCLCYLFQEHDCVPEIETVDGNSVIVTTYIDDRTVIRELIAALRPVSETVRLIQLTVAEPEEGSETVMFDLSILTPKQREALELAVVNGYFDAETNGDLGEMAEELGISKSALSQRLRVAQAKLVGDLFD